MSNINCWHLDTAYIQHAYNMHMPLTIETHGAVTES